MQISTDYMVWNCTFLVANATKNFALATTISQLVGSWRWTILCHDNYTNNNFDFQVNVIVGWQAYVALLTYIVHIFLVYLYFHTLFFSMVTHCLEFCVSKHYFKGEYLFIQSNFGNQSFCMVSEKKISRLPKKLISYPGLKYFSK